MSALSRDTESGYGTIDNGSMLFEPLRSDGGRGYRLATETVDFVKRSQDWALSKNAAMRRVREIVDRVAPTDATVLVRGESGVGKELVYGLEN